MDGKEKFGRKGERAVVSLVLQIFFGYPHI
jgi:hypothetical protein